MGTTSNRALRSERTVCKKQALHREREQTKWNTKLMARSHENTQQNMRERERTLVIWVGRWARDWNGRKRFRAREMCSVLQWIGNVGSLK